jgi:hypothetical protein
MPANASFVSVGYRVGGIVPALLVAILCTFGCSRHAPELPTEATTQTSPTPFQGDAAAGLDADSSTAPGAHEDHGPPFQKSDTVPAGALLTVRLKDAIVGVSGSKTPFEALLDDPVIVEGTAVIPRDTVVSGEIESALVSQPDRAYLCLTLSAVNMDGAAVPIQSAELYLRRQLSAASDPLKIRMEKGQRLTFRLKEQLFLHPYISTRSQ